MKTRFAKLSALGATAGLAVALVAGSAAMAAPHGAGGKKAPPAPTSSYSCATFSGLTLSQSSVSYSGVALRAGQTVTANAAPAASGDNIFLSTSMGLSLAFYEAPATTGLAFRAPADGVYNLGWTLRSSAGTTVPTVLSWTFHCS